MVRAEWNDEIIAESDQTVVVEGNHYFPDSSVRQECLRPSDTTTFCGWKGTAHYYTVVVDGKENKDAAWYYPEPMEAATGIKGRIAFWNGVNVQDQG
jgi:uncharacterized protein (DUF427 family)